MTPRKDWPLRVPALAFRRPRLFVALLRHPTDHALWGAWLTPQPSWDGWSWIGMLGVFGIAVHRRRKGVWNA